MGVTVRWVDDNPEDLKKVTEARLGSYGAGVRDREHFQISAVGAGQKLLLAEDNGRPVSTAVAFDQRVWVRGGVHPCQGVGYVGTIKTHRRIGGSRGEGYASLVMRQAIRGARERGQVLTTLMPFRNSFYEHFGYGVVERWCEWSIPMAALPRGDFAGMRFYEPDDLDELERCRQRVAEAGQCDMERSRPVWESFLKRSEHGFVAVDRPSPIGPIHGWIIFSNFDENGLPMLRLTEHGADSAEAFRRQLHFLASLKDQYASAVGYFPADCPLNWMLRESKVFERPRHLPGASMRLGTRMMARVLDDKRLIEGMRLPPEAKGTVTVNVQQTEGDVMCLTIQMEAGHASVRVQAGPSAQVNCTDRAWAAVVLGELRASQAARLGVIQCNDPADACLLDWFAVGPVPFCLERF